MGLDIFQGKSVQGGLRAERGYFTNSLRVFFIELAFEISSSSEIDLQIFTVSYFRLSLLLQTV